PPSRGEAASSKWQMANDEWQMANGRWQMANAIWWMATPIWRMAHVSWRIRNAAGTDGGRSMAEDQCAVKSGGYDGGQSGEPMPEVSLGRVLGHDSNRVIENSNNYRIGILSNGERTRKTGRARALASGRASLET